MATVLPKRVSHLKTTMKRLIPFLLLSILSAIASAQLKNPDDPCYWKDGNGICQTRAKLDEILIEHQKWFDSEGEQGEQANLYGADLRRAVLSDAVLSRAKLSRADLMEASLGLAKAKQLFFL